MAVRKVEVLQEAWGNRAPLQATARRRESAQATLRQQQADQRDIDLQLDELRAKIKKNSDKLYGGKVGNPRELQDLQAEVDQDRRLVSGLEDRSLGQMETVEQAQRLASEADGAHARAEEAWKNDQLAMKDEHATLKTRLASLMARRTALVAQADAAALRTYESLRKSKSGMAVARVSQRRCQGCHVEVTTKLEQQARISSDLVFCNSCGRILYAT
jgi:predicted  nucleic acid-binding Zn-ribbon protein